MSSKRLVSLSSFFKPLLFWVVLASTLSEHVTAEREEEQRFAGLGPFLKRNQRQTIISTEYGSVSEARVTDWNEPFQLHFITLEPNSVFLPVLLHSDMVFYVHTGSGRLSYQDEDEKESHRRLRRGNVHRLHSGTVFFIQSDLEPERQMLRIVAIFDNSEFDLNAPASGPYTSIRDLVLGFDKKVLQATFKVPEQVIEEITNGTKPPAIVRGLPKKKNTLWKMEFMEDVYNILDFSNKHKKSKLFNIFNEDPDFQNCNGWSTTVNKKKYGALKGSKYGVFMVNLTTGSMMGPHWNPVATEIALVLQGKGMIRVVCSSSVNESECKNTRFRVDEGDVFVVPRFHPMAQMAFNNETFVFMGFSTSIKKNHPQYLAGKASVLRTLDKHILATSFGVDDATYEKLLAQQDNSVILDCTSCAEEEWRRMEEEIEKERQKEIERKEEEARRKEKERRREEEEAKRREEEEAKRREEEEEKRAEEEARKKKEQEEAQRRQEEEREREEEKQREQEEAQRRREEEERERQEQQHREAEQEREAEARREEEAAKQAQAEAQRQQQEEREREQEERKEQEEAQRRREEEERERQEQQQREAEQEREAQARREEEAAKQAEAEAQRQQQEEKEAREREEEEAQRRREAQEQEEREREEQQREAEQEREAEARREEEAAKQAEEAAQGRGQGGSEGGRGQQEEGRGEQAPEETGGQQAAERRWEQAHGRGGEQQEGQGTGQGWARRILKKTT